VWSGEDVDARPDIPVDVKAHAALGEVPASPAGLISYGLIDERINRPFLNPERAPDPDLSHVACPMKAICADSSCIGYVSDAESVLQRSWVAGFNGEKPAPGSECGLFPLEEAETAIGSWYRPLEDKAVIRLARDTSAAGFGIIVHQYSNPEVRVVPNLGAGVFRFKVREPSSERINEEISRVFPGPDGGQGVTLCIEEISARSFVEGVPDAAANFVVVVRAQSRSVLSLSVINSTTRKCQSTVEHEPLRPEEWLLKPLTGALLNR